MTVKYFIKANCENENYNQIINSFRENNELITSLYINNESNSFNGANTTTKTNYIGDILSDGIIYFKINKTSDKNMLKPVTICGVNIYNCNFSINNLLYKDAVWLYASIYNANSREELNDLLSRIAIHYNVIYNSNKYNDSDIFNKKSYVKKAV